MIAVAALMLCALANAKGSGHAAAHSAEAEEAEPPVSVSRNPGEPEAEQPHTNSLFFNQAEGVKPASESGTSTDDSGPDYWGFFDIAVIAALVIGFIVFVETSD